MLAKRRALRVDGREIERTPLLVPHFPVKGFLTYIRLSTTAPNLSMVRRS